MSGASTSQSPARAGITARQFAYEVTPGPDPWIKMTGSPWPASRTLVLMPFASTVWPISGRSSLMPRPYDRPAARAPRLPLGGNRRGAAGSGRAPPDRGERCPHRLDRARLAGHQLDLGDRLVQQDG